MTPSKPTGFRCRSLVAAILAIAAPAISQDVRDWTSKAGDVSISGRFLELAGDAVVIGLANGERRRIPLGALSEADVQIAKAQSGKSEASRPTKVQVARSSTSDGSGRASMSGSVKSSGVMKATDVNPQLHPGESGGANQSESSPLPDSSFEDYGAELQDFLVDGGGNSVDLLAGGNEAPRGYLFVYAADWCRFCDDLMRDVVDLYGRLSERRERVIEFVLVYRGFSEGDAFAYMADSGVEFPMVNFHDRDSQTIPSRPGCGIPALRLVDGFGETIISTGFALPARVLDRVESLAGAR